VVVVPARPRLAGAGEPGPGTPEGGELAVLGPGRPGQARTLAGLGVSEQLPPGKPSRKLGSSSCWNAAPSRARRARRLAAAAAGRVCSSCAGHTGETRANWGLTGTGRSG